MTKERLPERSQRSESTQRNLKRKGEGLLRPPWLSPEPYILYTYTTGPSKIILFACQEIRTVKKCVITSYLAPASHPTRPHWHMHSAESCVRCIEGQACSVCTVYLIYRYPRLLQISARVRSKVYDSTMHML